MPESGTWTPATLGITRWSAFQISASRTSASVVMWSPARPEPMDWNHGWVRIEIAFAWKTCSVERREK